MGLSQTRPALSIGQSWSGVHQEVKTMQALKCRLRIVLRLAWLLLVMPWASPESVVAWLAETDCLPDPPDDSRLTPSPAPENPSCSQPPS